MRKKEPPIAKDEETDAFKEIFERMVRESGSARHIILHLHATDCTHYIIRPLPV
jgi:hypothetical protein